jgi:hypothetical protein
MVNKIKSVIEEYIKVEADISRQMSAELSEMSRENGKGLDRAIQRFTAKDESEKPLVNLVRR